MSLYLLKPNAGNQILSAKSVWSYVAGLIVTLLLSPTVSRADAPEGYPFLPFDQAMSHSQRDGKPLFVYFGRYGCGYCEKTNREAFIDPTVKARYTANYALAYVDAESGRRIRLHTGERITERELGTRYNALVTPVFTFLTPGGKPMHRMIGVQRIEDLIEADDKIQATLSKASQ